MPLVDTHCHLQSERFHDDREEVLARSLEVLDWLVVIGDDIPSSREILPLLRPRVYGTAGIHPYYAPTATEEGLAELESLLRTPGMVALGEIGLDYFNEYAPRDVQAKAFVAQLELAAKLQLPVVIHNREADADSLAILRDFMPSRIPGGIMHCFGSGPEFAVQCLEIGCYISFAGNITFPKAQTLRDASSVVPLDRLLVETDAPFLSPLPLRGKRCEPHYVQHTAEFIADLKGVAREELFAMATRNAERVYQLV